MRFVLFSMRDFERDGGGSIRMYGLLNALAAEGNDVVFISNAGSYNKFHPDVKHIKIGYEFKGKSIFQGLLGLFPASLIYYLYPILFKNIQKSLDKVDIQNDKLIFCEYLDNSIAYVLKKKDKIREYINDIHGIATIEFKYQRDNATDLKEKVLFNLKFQLSNMVDKKVFGYGDGFIYASQGMKDYYHQAYKKVKYKKEYIIPNVLSDEACLQKVDDVLKEQLLNKLNLDPKDFIFIFAGGYKATSGVEDLLVAINKLYTLYPYIKLLIIGFGPNEEVYKKLVKKLYLTNVVTFIGKVPYDKLLTYQSLANVIVCPDRQNPYSELIVHLKYFDALISEKLVVNGSFQSVKEINKDDSLSLSFEPSNTANLSKVLENCILNFQDLSFKYQGTRGFACENLTYRSFINILYS